MKYFITLEAESKAFSIRISEITAVNLEQINSQFRVSISTKLFEWFETFENMDQAKIRFDEIMNIIDK